MAKLTDMQIRTWIRSGDRFAGKSDGKGLTLVWRNDDRVPIWRFRYRFAGKPRTMHLGSYADLSLAKARDTVATLRAQVKLGHDVAGEKQERKKKAVAKIEAAKLTRTVGQLADEYLERVIIGRWKHPNIVRSRIERDIKPNIGSMAAKDVRPPHIDELLKKIVARGAPTTANDVLRWLRRIFDFGIKRGYLEMNPAAAFDLSDAGGREKARDRWLTLDELVVLFEAIRSTAGFTVENMHAVRLLLMLAIRKQELTTARVAEFDLDNAIWMLPAERTKTGKEIAIPLPPQAVASLRELIRLGDSSTYLLPARKAQDRMLPHIHENTLNQALAKLRPKLGAMPLFTVHDFRRTAKTQLQALGTAPWISERCLNHKLKGVEGRYDRYSYIDERREALEKWANVLERCENGIGQVTPIRKRASN